MNTLPTHKPSEALVQQEATGLTDIMMAGITKALCVNHGQLTTDQERVIRECVHSGYLAICTILASLAKR